MSIQETMGAISNIAEKKLFDVTLEVNERVTGISRDDIKKEILDEIVAEEKEIEEFNKVKEEGKLERKMNAIKKTTKYIDDETLKRFHARVSEYFKENDLTLDYKEEINSEGVNEFIFTVSEKIKEYKTAVKFTYNLSVSDTVETNINK